MSLDAGEYIVWNIILLTSYMDLRRMLVDGYVQNDTFDTFGYNNTRNHLLNLMNTEEFWNTGVFHLNRLNMNY